MRPPRALDDTGRAAAARRLCPTCGAEPWKPCITTAAGVEMQRYHQLRLPLWARATHRTRARRRR